MPGMVQRSMKNSSVTALNRREFVASLACTAVGVVTGCNPWVTATEPVGNVTFASRPHEPDLTIAPGLHALGIDAARDTLLFVPASYRADTPTPLFVALHGAGGSAAAMTGAPALADLEDFGIAMLAPTSRNITWSFDGADVAFIDYALEWTFRRLNVDPARLTLGGFSDGASVGLSLGLANGDLFPSVLGFSAGFLRDLPPVGKPGVFMSHGRQDPVLPFSGAEAIVARLRADGYTVDFVPFDGEHTVTSAVARQAYAWMLR